MLSLGSISGVERPRKTSIRSENCFSSTPRMNDWNTEDFAAADKKYLWHPFTSMHDWCAPEHEPLVLIKGHGAVLRDSTNVLCRTL